MLIRISILLLFLSMSFTVLAVDMGDPMYWHFAHWSSCWWADPGSQYGCGATAHNIDPSCNTLATKYYAWLPTEAGGWNNEPECEYTPIVRANGCHPSGSCNWNVSSGSDVFFQGPYEGNHIPPLKYGVAFWAQAVTASTVWTAWVPSGTWSPGESWINMSMRQCFDVEDDCSICGEIYDFSSGWRSIISVITEKPYNASSGGYRNCKNVVFSNDAVLVEYVTICSNYNPAVGCIEVGYPPVGSAAEYQWFVKNEGLVQLRNWTFTGIQDPGSVDCSGTYYYKDENDYQWCWLTGWAVSTHPYQAKKPTITGTDICWWGQDINPASAYLHKLTIVFFNCAPFTSLLRHTNGFAVGLYASTKDSIARFSCSILRKLAPLNAFRESMPNHISP